MNVAIISGGISSESEVSLSSGKTVADNIDNKHTVIPITLSSLEDFHALPEQLSDVDIAYIALHGTYGEDGYIQAICEKQGIPFTSSGSATSLLAMDKYKTQQLAQIYDVRVPQTLVANKSSIPSGIPYPCVVKPNASGSSRGTQIVHGQDELLDALVAAFNESDSVLIQEYIAGREFACAVIGNTDQTDLQPLPPIEIIPTVEFFDYDAKYHDASTKEVCPADINEGITHTIQKWAQLMHQAIGCDGLTRSDFLLDTNGHVYFLELNTIPGFTPTSLAPQEAIAAGMTLTELIEKQLELGLLRQQKSPN